MADRFVKTYKYTKGIYEANFYSLADRTLMYHDSKLTDANIASSINNGEILAGLGNAPQIMLFDTARFAITLTAQDIDIRQYQLQTGGTLSGNGITQTCEVIDATGTSLVLGSTPAVPYGYDTAVCYINGEGTAYTVDVTTKTVQGFTAVAGKQYSVRYYVAAANKEVLDIGALFTPEICSCEIKMPVYAAPTSANANSGTLVGNLWAIVPRFQFDGSATINATQTGNVTPALSGSALAADNPSVTDCAASAMSSLIYLVWEPVNANSGIEDMVVLGGGALTVAAGSTKAIPVKFVLEDGILAQPDLTALSYTSSTTSVATVSNGIVTGVSEGSTDITITYTADGKTFTAYCAVTVTA